MESFKKHQHQKSLPQMKSIWLDEDQEAEKLYGLQAQQYMESDNEDDMEIKLLNSSKPVLSNKNNIELPPLVTSKVAQYAGSKKSKINSQKKSSKTSFLNLFKSKNETKSVKFKGISTPFGFQHISHAGGKPEEELSGQGKDLKITNPDKLSTKSEAKETEKTQTFRKVFVTESLPTSESRPLSVSSSVYSAGSSKKDRIMSMSTMATTILDRTPSFNRLGNATPKKPVVKHKHANSDASEVSVDFLRNYKFPTLLENEQMQTFESYSKALNLDSGLPTTQPVPPKSNLPQLHKNINHVRSNSTTTTNSSVGSRMRSNSLQQSFSTPELEEHLFASTPIKRISVDDILRYYHQPNGESVIQSPIADPGYF